MDKPTEDPTPFRIGDKFSHGGTVFIDHPDVRISSDEWNLVELTLPEVANPIEHDKLLYQKLVDTYVNDTYRNRVDYWSQGFKTVIPLPSA